MRKFIIAAVISAAVVAAPTLVVAAGNLASPPSTPIEIALTGAGPDVSSLEFSMETGVYYRIVLTSDGGAEALFSAPALFDNSWINQIVVAGAEIKLLGTGFKGVEVGEEGPNTVTITFLPVRPGNYAFYIESEGETIEGVFHVE